MLYSRDTPAVHTTPWRSSHWPYSVQTSHCVRPTYCSKKLGYSYSACGLLGPSAPVVLANKWSTHRVFASSPLDLPWNALHTAIRGELSPPLGCNLCKRCLLPKTNISGWWRWRHARKWNARCVSLRWCCLWVGNLPSLGMCCRVPTPFSAKCHYPLCIPGKVASTRYRKSRLTQYTLTTRPPIDCPPGQALTKKHRCTIVVALGFGFLEGRQ